MNRVERAFTVFYWAYILVYLCCFVGLAATGLIERSLHFVIPLHIFGMFLGLAMLIVVFRDLYKRDFPNPNTKVTWAILMLMFWPSILVYLYKHGFRPRPTIGFSQRADEVGTVLRPVKETGNPYQSPGL